MAVRLPLLALLAAAALALPAGANAAIVPGTTIDGPSADVVSAHDIDFAPDGSGALVYLKKDGGVDHVFVSRYVGGAWQPPERVDTGQTQASRIPQLAAANGGKLVVAWMQDMAAADPVRSTIKPSASEPFDQTFVQGDNANYAVNVDMNPNGVAYAVYTSLGSPAYDVRASRLNGKTWTAVGDVFPNPGGRLDFDGSKDAGIPDTQNEPRVAVDAAGNATAIWGEEPNLGERETYMRRLNGTSLGPTAHKVAIDTLDGAPRSTTVNHPDIDTDDAGTAWGVFREFFTYATDKPRILARSLTGETLGPAQLIDNLPATPAEGNEFPRVDINGSGQGLAAMADQLDPFDTTGAALGGGTWTRGFRVDTGTNKSPSFPVAALGENGSGMFAWKHDPGGGGAKTILARRYEAGALAPNELVLADPAFGPAEQSQLEAGADANGNVGVVFTQGPAATRRVVVAMVDGPPPPVSLPPVDEIPDVTGVAVVPSTFTEGSKLPALLAATGTTINFALTEDARTRISFELGKPGRLVGTKCKKPTRANRKRKKCTRYSKIKTPIDVNGKAGANRLRFQGRLTKKRRLKPGRYRLTVVATDSAGQASVPDQAKFRMKARKRKRSR